MPLTSTSFALLHQAVASSYKDKTILSNVGVPFTVLNTSVEDNEVWFRGGDAQYRCVAFDEALPEVWPFEVPMSPCS